MRSPGNISGSCRCELRIVAGPGPGCLDCCARGRGGGRLGGLRELHELHAFRRLANTWLSHRNPRALPQTIWHRVDLPPKAAGADLHVHAQSSPAAVLRRPGRHRGLRELRSDDIAPTGGPRPDDGAGPARLVVAGAGSNVGHGLRARGWTRGGVFRPPERPAHPPAGLARRQTAGSGWACERLGRDDLSTSSWSPLHKWHTPTLDAQLWTRLCSGQVPNG